MNGGKVAIGVETARAVEIDAARLVPIDTVRLDDVIDYPPLLEPAPRRVGTQLINGQRWRSKTWRIPPASRFV
jgi:hypothetical protein